MVSGQSFNAAGQQSLSIHAAELYGLLNGKRVNLFGLILAPLERIEMV